MITLYHGSYTQVNAPRVNAGRRNLDFGKGFYVTNLKLQAEKWAIIIGGRHNDDDWGVVSEYGFDDSSLEKYNVLRFADYDIP